MSTPSGTISATDVENILNEGGVNNYPGGKSRLTFNDTLVRTLAARPSGAISMNDMRGKAGPLPYGTLISSSCSGTTLVGNYADGRYGQYQGYTANSPLCAPTTITLYYLMIGAGGGGSGPYPDDRGGGGGGGGGGGMRTGTISITKDIATSIGIQLGTGGPGGGTYNSGTNGDSTYLFYYDSGSYQKAIYGGQGGQHGRGGNGGNGDFPDAKTGNPGGAAGPGGSGNYNYAGGANGTSNSGGSAAIQSGGGGGGGSDDYPPTGAGGNGYLWSVTGAYYGGGGGGGGDYSGTASGGAGGGGLGSVGGSQPGVDGLGGGGGGGSSAADSAWPGQKGGNGCVILAYTKLQNGVDYGKFLSGGVESSNQYYYIHTFTNVNQVNGIITWIK